MVILDAPFASPRLIEWLEATEHPVLENAFTRTIPADLNLVSEAEAASRINAGERVYTNSENALAWILENTENEGLKGSIRIFKDKARMREVLAEINPDFFYKTLSRNDLASVEAGSLPLPVVLKPSVGFCSMGVYVIESPADWDDALRDIADHEKDWAQRYPESVVASDLFIIEGYLSGTEYAIDMYYDESGAAHILNIMRHDFAGPEDTSDRVYRTDKSIVDSMLPRFKEWLDQVNEVIGAQSFPIHVEIRVDEDGIIPIEFNPLRFAGLGGTDIAYYGIGVRTYADYLMNAPVDLAQLYKAHVTDVYTMSLLNPSPEADLSKPFDFEALKERFSDVLDLYEFDVNKIGSFGFLFLRTDVANEVELSYLLHTDLMEFQEND